MSSDLGEIINEDVKAPEIDLKKDLHNYRKTLHYMGSNVPIQVLCLPKSLEKTLIKEGLIRVYDLISCDLTEIKGIGSNRLSLLTSRLDEFFTVSI